MASIYDAKAQFQNFLRPLSNRLVSLGVTANQVTILACALSAFYGLGLWLGDTPQWMLIALPAFQFIRMAMNAIDGMLAREHGQKSPLGALLNELTDVIADVALYLPLALMPGMPAALIVGVVLIGVISEFAGVAALSVGSGRRYDGPFGKSDRAFFFGALALALGLGLAPGQWTNIVFFIAIAASILTILNRIRSALKEVSHG
ncbi:MAG: CDP-alcohol phosphatidyltransferase family protein [Pseudomonadota bacterium]